MCERYTQARSTIARGDQAPVQLPDGIRELRWGLLAPWRGHGGKRGPMIYEAAADAIDATPVLRTARAKRRCLVIADGWFLTRKVGAKRQPIWIHGTGPVTFAGLAAIHADDGIESFAIVTVPATGIVAPLAATMPAIVDERWLAHPELVTRPFDGWKTEAVASFVAPPQRSNQGELF